MTLLILLVLCIGVPCLQAQTSVSEKRMKYVIEDTSQGLKIEYNGKITLSLDDRSIKAISDGGYLRIEKTTFGNSRELLINSRGNDLNYEYREGGRLKPYEPDGKAWFSDILPELVKTTPIAAEHRVERLFSKGGVKAVTGALPDLKGENVRAAFISYLLKKDIKEEDLTHIIQTVGSVIQSDVYRYDVFRMMFPAHSKSPALLLKAVGMLGSDVYRMDLIQPVVQSQILAGQQQQALQLINTVKSDVYKTDIAISLDFDKVSDKQLSVLLESLMTRINSDVYRKDLLMSVLQKNTGDENRLLILVNSTSNIKSDVYKADFLKDVCLTNPGEKVKARIREAAKSIKSSVYYGEVIRCLD
ncbi:hypothetical protein ACFS7Z_26205 [Pontibacter toksunensis]|uniref:Uncharacterized protein n=1 Tax=Pontibacter toksunensis TaxID=1332631 RepID=A0ABW6C390_9BACT